jgi:DNA-binding NtrC family response regulator
MTGYASIDSLVEGLRLGVCDYVSKPITQEKIRAALVRAVRVRSSVMHSEPHSPPSSARDDKHPKADVVAQSAAMREILRLVARVAPTSAPVFIQGETGVGKGLIARMIHEQSPRACRPFVHVNCSAQSPELLLRQLCGHESGATVASGEQRAGLFERARGGTLFLDNVHELPLRTQAGLLDCLQEDRPCRIGGNDTVPTDVRLVSATTIDLNAAVTAGRFHRGLHNDLNVVCIEIPPLRRRSEDLRALAKHFLTQCRRESGLGPHETRLHFSDAAADCLLNYDWPGNVRELAKVVEHAVLLAEGDEIGLDSLPESLRKRQQSETGETVSVPLTGNIKEIERNVIREVIDRCHGNKAAAARSLGMHRRTLYRLLAATETENPSQPPTPSLPRQSIPPLTEPTTTRPPGSCR